METQPTVSAIIASKDRFDMVSSLINDLRRQDYPQDKLEILVIDDGSTPAYQFPDVQVTLIRHEKAQGAQKSRNEGIKTAQGTIAFMLDDDIELLNNDFISRAIDLLHQHQDVAAVFGRHIAVKHGPEEYTWEQLITRPTLYSGELIQYHAPAGPIDWGNQVFLVKRHLLLEIGGYDGIFGLNGGHSFREESDLHARLRRQGYTLWYLTDIAYKHHIVETGGHGPAIGKRLYWIAHNHIIFIKRHLRLWPLRAIGFLYDIARYNWFQGRFRYILNMLHGYCAGWRNALRDHGTGQNHWLEQQ
ncbi:MAG: glycosyltransferase [Sedimentisphaerales bacterium]|nr:glycosyltransferase [Sedimentisphaerales bacterium]